MDRQVCAIETAIDSQTNYLKIYKYYKRFKLTCMYYKHINELIHY